MRLRSKIGGKIPIIWIPLIWCVICGAASSRKYTWTLRNVFKIAPCLLLSGPLMAGYIQTTNNLDDREIDAIDAINEPYRPIPSGVISAPRVVNKILMLFELGLALGYVLDIWACNEFPIKFSLTLGGAFLAYIYSAPPLNLK